jgi:hypothetical protein
MGVLGLIAFGRMVDIFFVPVCLLGLPFDRSVLAVDEACLEQLVFMMEARVIRHGDRVGSGRQDTNMDF